jgi:hypothetical protein
MNIVATRTCNPTPNRNWDYQAVDTDTYEGGSPMGVGATEAEAIKDLLEQFLEMQEKSEPGLWPHALGGL